MIRTALATLTMLVFAGDAQAEVKTVVPIKARPFPPTDVRLLESPFRHAMELDHKYLLELDVDRLLHAFRLNAGLPSTAEPLGGWEEPKCEVRGHFVGHYMTAVALMYADTGDQRLKEKGDRLVAGLAQCQAKFPSGYLSAFPESFIERVEAGKPVWAPWYTLHKIYAGLLDMHVYCGNRQALDVLEKACGWIESRADKLNDEQMQLMLRNEHGGMNDVLAELAAVTGKDRWLKLSQRFNHRAVLDPLAKREDKLTGLHANTQFPKILGAARQYELTGDPALRTTTEFFWDVVTRERSYATGGNSDGEMFTAKEHLSEHLGQNTTESCNTYNMLKITRRLFQWEPRAELADYYERALYNHILASQNPATGMMLYYLPLRSGVARKFGGPNDAFWCCYGTGIENHARYGESIYFHDDRSLWVNLFIPSELQWKQRGLAVRQENRYPDEPATRLQLTCEKPQTLEVRIRHPFWTVEGFEIRINGQPLGSKSRPGSFATVSREWKTGDVIEVRMPMSLRTESFRDNPRRLAIFCGPILLCTTVKGPDRPMPAIVADPAAILPAIAPTNRPLHFTASAAVFRTVEEKAGGVNLVPFFRQYQEPCHVYWDVLDDAQWNKRLEAYRADQARAKALDGKTIDRVVIGDPASESAHKLQGEKTSAGDFGGRHWRHAPDGWFSFELRLSSDRSAKTLLCSYWGSDVGREFDVLVDGVKIATQKLDNNRPGQFFDQEYALPANAAKGKQTITVRFQAHEHNTAGGVFDLRLLE